MQRRVQRWLAELRRRRVLRSLSLYAGLAWLVIGIGDIAFPLFGAPPWLLEAVIWGALFGLPCAGLAAWFWQLVPENDEPRAPTDTASRKLPWDVVLFASLLAALAVSVTLNLSDPRLAEAPARLATPTSLAVLPFADLSEGQSQRYLADGLAEELLTVLARHTTLPVAARTSSFVFRDQTIGVPAIAAQLGVSHVLEGSVRRENDDLRVDVQLIDGHTGFRLWNNRYDATIDRLLVVQEQIAQRIVGALEAGVLDTSQRQHAAPAAYIAYLRASELARQGSGAALAEAAAQFEQALALDPSFAPAWARLANVYANLGGQGHEDYADAFTRSRQAAQRAVEADPAHPGGYVQLAWVAHRHEGDLEAAASAMQRALALEPASVSTLRAAAVLLLQLGKVEDAIRLLESCARRSPLDPRGFFNLGVAQKYADDLDAARRSFERVLKLSPNYNGVQFQLGELHLLRGETDQAAALLNDLPGFRGPFGRALTAHARGDSAGADLALTELIEGWGDTWPSTIADVFAFRGETTAAFEWLDKDIEKFGAAGWGELKLSRLLDNLKRDPRWFALLERVGASESRLNAITLDLTGLP